jgi:hypothetical protein
MLARVSYSKPRHGSDPIGSPFWSNKMAKSNKYAGQFNLRGKKTLRLRCRCCVCQDMRERIEKIRIRREIKEMKEYVGE